MIDREKEAEIVRLYFVEKWPIGTIAAQLGLHHDAVARVIERDGVPRAALDRPSRITPFLPFIRDTLEKYPELRASRLHVMCRERGYRGGVDHFRHVVSGLRPRPAAEAYLRLKTLPGAEAQVDWGHFGKVLVGRAPRYLVAFVMVLSYSRRIFLRFFLGQKTENFLRGHDTAFRAFGGVPRLILVDNLKSAVLERVGPAIHFNPILLSFAAHYRFEVRPVAIARGNEKGRVERAIRFVRDRFFAAREWRDVTDLNAQAQWWCDGEASDRPWPEDRASGKTVRDAFEEERPLLLPLPLTPFPCEERIEARIGKTPYVRFDGNDYSVPHPLVRRTLWVLASETEVRILDGNDVVATHGRSYDRGRAIEDPAHIDGLEEEKAEARRGHGQDRLTRSAPSARQLFEKLAERGFNLGNATVRLLKLLDDYGAERLEKAIAEAIAKDTPHLHAIRNVLERDRTERGEPPPIPVVLPENEAVRNLTVRPHALSTYDELASSNTIPSTPPEGGTRGDQDHVGNEHEGDDNDDDNEEDPGLIGGNTPH
jgi:transposase